jgi:hypothetical protein
VARFSGGAGGEGTPGPEGPAGPPGADALWNFRGAYSGGAAYAVGDVATYNGQTWYRLNSNGGNVGDTPAEGTFWTLIAAEGDAANTGDITFDGVKIIGAGTASGDGANLGTIELVPDGDLTSDQYIIIDPTAPNHIHIRAGGTQDASNADLIIGGEDTNLLVSDTGDYVDIRTTSETATNIWRFGSDGILSGPGMSTLYTYWITAPESSLKLSSSSDQVILNGATGEFLNDETDPANQIATIGDINNTVSAITSYSPVWSGTGLAFTGTPAIGTYVKIGNLVQVQIDVNFTNVTNFGSGQYSLTLPHPSKYHTDVYGGSIHNVGSTTDHYSLKGHLLPTSSTMTLWYISGSSQDQIFDHNSPINLVTADKFYMSFSYICE